MRWSREEINLLGTDTDRAIAARIGRGHRAVESMRLKRGIAPAHPHAFHWTPARIAMIGSMVDAALAARLGIDFQTVFRKRRKMGIAPHCPFRSPIKN